MFGRAGGCRGEWAAGQGGAILDFNLDLKELFISSLAPGGLSGDAASAGAWDRWARLEEFGEWNHPGHLRRKYKKRGTCTVSLPSPRSQGGSGGVGRACSLAHAGPRAGKAPGGLWALQRKASVFCWVSAAANACRDPCDLGCAALPSPRCRSRRPALSFPAPSHA